MENYTTKNQYNALWLNGKFYDTQNLQLLCQQKLQEEQTPEYERIIFDFINDWINPDIVAFTVFTSGSTGAPKPIQINKEQMIASAHLTGQHFELNGGDTALLCLPVQRIAGKMMLVRSLVLGLHLWTFEKITDVKNFKKNAFKFAAFTPAQAAQILLLGQEYAIDFFAQFSKVLLGGSPLLFDLKRQLLQHKNTQFYQSFAMTETVSHIAICHLNNLKSMTYEYEILAYIDAGTDARGCLWVQGEVTGGVQVFSNDLVRFSDQKTFEWLGRWDNVVNSGGIKLLPEQIEAQIQEMVDTYKDIFQDIYKTNFFVCGLPHPIFGEQLVMVVQTDKILDANNIILNIKKYIKNKYEVPKQVLTLEKFVYLPTGKLDRRTIKTVLSKA